MTAKADAKSNNSLRELWGPQPLTVSAFLAILAGGAGLAWLLGDVAATDFFVVGFAGITHVLVRLVLDTIWSVAELARRWSDYVNEKFGWLVNVITVADILSDAYFHRTWVAVLLARPLAGELFGAVNLDPAGRGVYLAVLFAISAGVSLVPQIVYVESLIGTIESGYYAFTGSALEKNARAQRIAHIALPVVIAASAGLVPLLGGIF